MALLCLLAAGPALTSTSVEPAAIEDGRDLYGTWWRGGKGAAELKRRCPWVKGVFAALHWGRLEPRPEEFDWDYFDNTLQEYADAGFYIQFMVWVGPHSPRWIYEHGVPEVKTTPKLNPRGEPHTWTYPYYLDDDYRRFYHRMIRRVAEHVDRLPARVRERIICLQTAEGTTGDEGGYKGSPLDPRYELPSGEWEAFKFETWRLFEQLYRDKKPRIHLLINSGNQGQYHDWLMQNMPETWRKAGNPGHGYQLNDEMFMLRFLDPIINHDAHGRGIVRCRSEMDEMFKGWFREAPVWNMYWLNLWGLHFGIDIFQHSGEAFEDRRHDEGFIFYSKYGGRKDPARSPGAWCALRDGLDAADTKRFPVEKYGRGELNPRAADQSEGIRRCLNIAGEFAQYGAAQGDPAKAMMRVMENRDAKAMNDVGWNIWPGNYQRYLVQIDPQGTSRGWWRVGPKDQPYGRFARGFDVAAGKNVMYFDLDDQFFANLPPGAARAARVRVVYFDRGRGEWELRYDAAGGTVKTAISIKNGGSDRWKEAEVSLEGAGFSNAGERGSDLMLVNCGKEDVLFHMLEITGVGPR